MRIEQIYSHLGGYEFIMVHHPGIWQEVEQIIAAVDTQSCPCGKSRAFSKSRYSLSGIRRAFVDELRKRDWRRSKVCWWTVADSRLLLSIMEREPEEQRQAISSAGETPIFSYNQTDFVKDRIAIEVQFGKYSFVAYDLFVKHMAFYVGDVIDVGVEILPMKELQAEMSSGVAYYEGELYNLIRQGRGVPAVPLVLIGIAP